MDSKHREFKKLKRNRFGVKMMAGSFLLVGGILFITFLMAYLDPEATIKVNDVSTNSPRAKLGAVLFSSMFVILGLAGLLLPRHFVNRMLIARTSLLSAGGESFFQKLYRFLKDYPLRSCVLFAGFTTVAVGGHFYNKFVDSEDGLSVVLEFLFILGFATAFYYFASKLMLWFVLKVGGFGLGSNKTDS